METSITNNPYGNNTGIAPVSPNQVVNNPKDAIGYVPGTLPGDSINSSSLTPTTPYKLPSIPISTDANAVSGITSSTIDQTNKALAQDYANKQAMLSGSTNTLTDLQNQIIGVQGQRADLEKQAGLDRLNTNIADLTNTLESSQKAQDAELKALNGSGMTDVQKSQAAREINRKYAVEQSDTLFALNQTQRRFDSAQANIDRKIKLQLEPLQTKLDFAKQFYQDNKDAFTKSEDRAFQNLIATNKQKYDQALATQTAIGDIQKEALKSGISIPLSVLSQINNAKSANEAYSILQANGISIQDPLEKAKKQADLALTYANIAKIKNESTVLSIKDAQLLGVPYGTTKGQAIALGKTPGVSQSASELKTSALNSAQALLDKINNGTGTSAIGSSRILGLQYIPGSNAKDFQVQLDNLKSLLSLDNVKLLKGQGQVSDAERLLLERASGKLDPGQSEESFKSAVQDVIKALSGEQTVTSNGNQYQVGQVYQDASGAKWTVDANGKWTKQ